MLWCRSVITEAIGGELEFVFFHKWFNSLFLISSLCTMVMIYVQFKQAKETAFDLPVYVRH